jgi:hypothetical protein
MRNTLAANVRLRAARRDRARRLSTTSRRSRMPIDKSLAKAATDVASASVAIGALMALAALASPPFAYPPEGRSDGQQRQDRYECHEWAVEQSHFDPTQPAAPAQPSPGSRTAQTAGTAGGAAIGGAARGAAVAKVADGDTSDGAKAGAAFGLLRPRRAQGAATAQQSQAEQAAAHRQAQDLQAKQRDYERARSTCFKARGYTLSEG